MSGPEISTLINEGLGNCSYVVDLGDGRALVVDPGRDPRPYLADAEKRGLRIAVAAETPSTPTSCPAAGSWQPVGRTWSRPVPPAWRSLTAGWPAARRWTSSWPGSSPASGPTGYFRELRELNCRGLHVYGRYPVLAPLEAGTVKQMAGDGALIVDVRPVASFAAGHVAGGCRSNCGPSSPAGSAGWWAASAPRVRRRHRPGPRRPRAPVPGHRLRAPGRRAGRRHRGVASPRPARSHCGPRGPGRGGGRSRGRRQRFEFDAGHVPGGISMELGKAAALGCTLPAGPLTLMCGHGERAMTAGRASWSPRVGAASRCCSGGPADVAAANGRRVVG